MSCITSTLTGLPRTTARGKTPEFQADLVDAVLANGDATDEQFENAFDPCDMVVYGPAHEFWTAFREHMPWGEDSPAHQKLVGWLLRALVSALGIYPIGTVLQLSSGDVVEVLASKGGAQPRVRLVVDARGAAVTQNVEVDLTSRPDLQVARVLSIDGWRKGEGAVDVEKEAAALDRKAAEQLRALYENLDPWQKTLVARHPARPHCKDYIEALFSEWMPLAGDRAFGDDHAVMGGLARFRDAPVVVIGHEKGADTEDRVKRNFGMAKPEGYRKARRLMQLADRFKLPLVALVDTPGAYPGVEAESRGQVEAIARCLETCMAIRVPFVAAILGEGGSGGAIAIAAANRVLMFEHAVYSVITPEGCASILWRSAEQAKDAAEALKLTAQDLMKLGIVDGIVPEPMGGAHRDHDRAIEALGAAIRRELDSLAADGPETLKSRRREKYLEMGRRGIA